MRFSRITSAVFAAGISLMLAGCGGAGGSSPTSAEATASSDPAAVSEPTTEPAATGITYNLWCYGGSSSDYITMEQAWAEPSDDCGAKYLGGEPSPVELAALSVSERPEVETLETLYALCAETTGHYFTHELTSDNAKIFKGALMLCPDHPKYAHLTSKIKAGLAREASEDAEYAALKKEKAARDADRAAGKYVDDGKYLVGKDVKPGTWQSQGAKVEDCYWEVSDAQGNIIQNNFISVAPQFTITVPATAAGFTVSRCSFRWIGG